MLLYLICATVGFYITYLIIKIAVKHAIRESSGDMRFLIKESITAALAENEWKKG